ncbi:MAG: TlpA disulfide reductase family protein [Rhizobiaceae bacterium]
MNQKMKSSGARFFLLAAGLLALAAAGMMAVYGNSGHDGNVALTDSCPGAAETVKRLEGLNTGDVAAFQLASEPEPIGELVFADENARPGSIRDQAGKSVLLNLWATWCAPCREEMPALDRLQASLGGPDFQVVPVSIDLRDDAKPKAFYAETGLEHLPFYHDGSLTVFNTLKKRGLAFGMPSTLLLDPQGCVLGWMNGPADWSGQDAMSLISAAIAR